MKRNVCAAAALWFSVLLGCDNATDPEPVLTGPNGVFILNEGAFRAGNAELSFLDDETGTVTGNLYASANNGQTLGDVANAMAMFEGRLFIAVNNSLRIDVIDATSHQSYGRIALPGLPRQIVVANERKAYVTMQDSTVAIIDPGTFSYVRSITTGPIPDGIIRAGGRIFVLNSGFGSGSSITVMDEASDSIIATIGTPMGPTHAAMAGDGRFLVVCTGFSDWSDPTNDTHGAVLLIDAAALAIIDSLTIEGHPGKLAVDASGTVFLLGPGQFPATPVWKLETSPSLRVISQSFIDGSFYGIGIHEERQEIMLADAGSFVTNGRVLIYDDSGTLRRTLTSGIGIAPASFLITGQ